MNILIAIWETIKLLTPARRSARYMFRPRIHQERLCGKIEASVRAADNKANAHEPWEEKENSIEPP